VAEDVKNVASFLEKMRLEGVQTGEGTLVKRKFHCLKHSIATHLLAMAADLAFVKDWL
jgi:site-specific recombinase XerD